MFQRVRGAAGRETPGKACVCMTVYPGSGGRAYILPPNDSMGMLAISATLPTVSQKCGEGIHSIQRWFKTQTPCWLTGERCCSSCN